MTETAVRVPLKTDDSFFVIHPDVGVSDRFIDRYFKVLDHKKTVQMASGKTRLEKVHRYQDNPSYERLVRAVAVRLMLFFVFITMSTVFIGGFTFLVVPLAFVLLAYPLWLPFHRLDANADKWTVCNTTQLTETSADELSAVIRQWEINARVLPESKQRVSMEELYAIVLKLFRDLDALSRLHSIKQYRDRGQSRFTQTHLRIKDDIEKLRGAIAMISDVATFDGLDKIAEGFIDPTDAARLYEQTKIAFESRLAIEPAPADEDAKEKWEQAETRLRDREAKEAAELKKKYN